MVVRVARTGAGERRDAASWSRPTTSAVRDAVAAHGLLACMTRADHPTGTDRLAEAAMALGLADDEIVVERAGRRTAARSGADAAAWRCCWKGIRTRRSPPRAIRSAMRQKRSIRHVVKVVLDAAGYALYFSRATIPWARDAFAQSKDALPPGLPLYRHYGLYAYRMSFLRAFPALAPAPIERFEALEQLRALWHGFRIVVEITGGTPAPGIDTPRISRACGRSMQAGVDHVYSDERTLALPHALIGRYHTSAVTITAAADKPEGTGTALRAAQFIHASHDHAIDSARPARRG